MKRWLLAQILSMLLLLGCSRPAVDTLFEMDRRLSAQSHNGLSALVRSETLFLPASGHPVYGGSRPLEMRPGPWHVKHATVARSEEMGLTWGWLFDQQRHYASLWRRIDGVWALELQMNFVDSLLSPNWVPPVADPGAASLFAADRAFAAMADTAGMAAAFAAFIADNGVALGSGEKVNRKEDFQARAGKDLDFKLRWRPIYGRVARSGDFGFTLGRYTSAQVFNHVEVPEAKGYYLSVWRKDASGRWRFIFDGGNVLPPVLSTRSIE